jgi:hypothetical protein
MNPKNYTSKDKRTLTLLKKKLGVSKEESTQAGDLISKMNEKKRLSIKGLV